MDLPLPISGTQRPELLALFQAAPDWQQEGQLLIHDHKAIFSLAPASEPHLPLLPRAEQSWAMLGWFYHQQLTIRLAQPEDLVAVCQLKEELIKENFAFFSPSELQSALQRSASQEYMSAEISAGNIYLGLNGGQLWAMAGMKDLSQREAFFYSWYSRGNKSGAALAAYLLYLAQISGAEEITSNVYQQNTQGAAALQQFTFQRQGQPRQSTYVPGHPIYRWRRTFTSPGDRAH